jgi:pimeloyl-ACP methyl ester carboxylesterase
MNVNSNTPGDRPRRSRRGTRFCPATGRRSAIGASAGGPGVVILHGSMESADSHTELAAALADEFAVHLPDRRGHGDSGPGGDDYGIGTEVEDQTVERGRVTMRQLAPTLRYEGMLIQEMDGRLDTFTDVQARVLLMGGSKGQRYLKPALAALARVLPRCERVEFPGWITADPPT